MMRSNQALSILVCLSASIPAAAQVKLSQEQGAELTLLCKTRMQPVPKVDWNDFCSCLAGMTELKLSRPQYVSLRAGLMGSTPVPITPPLRALLNECIEATAPLQPGTEVIIPKLPAKAPAKTY